MSSQFAYDLILLLLRAIFYIFFREVYPRGVHNIPQHDPVILAIAPHHNQFLDFHVAIQVYKETGRRTRFLVAASSMQMRVIGFLARLVSSIPVARAQDYAKTGTGRIYLDEKDPCLIHGEGTSFTTELEPRKQIVLPKSVNSVAAEVAEVVSNTEVRLKREFSDDTGSMTERVREVMNTTDGYGFEFKVLPHLDQADMYRYVHSSLSTGGLIGIFPEGGSHDRPGLLPLKAGVAIMALGTMTADPTAKIKIVPTGLSYFHAHMFRSRCVIEFGAPIDVPFELVEMYKRGGVEKREAVTKLMGTITQGLTTVTTAAPDFETLMVTQAARRLYETPGQQPTLGQVVELNRRFLEGYLHFKDEPRIVALRQKVLKYNRAVRDLGLRDHQVPRAEKQTWKTLSLIAYRYTLLVVWSTLALPGFILNAPIFLTASAISRKKAKEALAKSTVKIQANDVIGTWKVLISLGLAPLLYTFYAIIATVVASKAGAGLQGKFLSALGILIALPFVNFSALKFGEAGMDVLKSLRPLIVNLVPGQQKSLQELKCMRAELSNELADVVNTFGPKFYTDFDEWRALLPSANAPPSPMLNGETPAPRRRRNTRGAQGSFLIHPMTWLDERLFGWRSAYEPAAPGVGFGKDKELSSRDDVSPYSSDLDSDVGDYDDVLGQMKKGVNLSTRFPQQGSYRDMQRLHRLRSRLSTNFQPGVEVESVATGS